MRSLKALALAAGCLAVGLPAWAGDKTIQKSGTDLAVALPLIAGGLTLYNQDYVGTLELAVDGLATVGTVYGLSRVIHEERPNHGDDHSFPSDTEAVAFAPAAFLWDRYGWQYGVPAYFAAGYVAYSRVEAGKHHWWDVTASAAIGLGYDKIFTTKYLPPNVSTGLSVTPKSGMFRVGYRW